jgi:GAF domain-containing protein
LASQLRNLTREDIGVVMAMSADRADPRELYREVEHLARQTCGFKLFTVLEYVEDAQAVERIHSSDEKAYPVGGRKPLDKIKDTHEAMESGSFFLAATKDDVRKAYFDHELIFSLGIGAILNVPIRHAGRRLGTLNLCGTEGSYGPAAIENAKLLAGLLVPTLLDK